MKNDTYKTLAKASKEAIFKDRGSKFLGYGFPIQNEDQVKTIIEGLKKQHPSARHWCYAWQLGDHYEHFRASDDGEPSNSAGKPIYGQLQAFNVTNTVVVVVRYFGGTKLGVGGLIQAYKTAAKMTLENAAIVTQTIEEQFELQFEYAEMNLVMRMIKEQQLTIIEKQLEMNCRMVVTVRLKDATRIFQLFDSIYKVSIRKRDA